MVTNRVFHVLVTNGTTAASIAALTAGQYLIITRTGTVVTAANAGALDGDEEVQIVVAAPDGTRVFSSLIRLKDIKYYNTGNYRAKVEQVTTVAVGTPVVGKQYNIAVINKSDKEILQYRQDKRTYSVEAGEAETSTTLATKFRAKINGDPDAIVVASGTGGNVVLTAKSIASVPSAVGDFPLQYVFEVFAQEIGSTAFDYLKSFGTVTYTTAADFGSGNAWQLRKLEQRGAGYTSGISNFTQFPVGDPGYKSVLGTNYDIFVIGSDDRHDTNVVSQGEWEAPITTYIAVTAGASAGIKGVLDILATK